MVVSYMWCVYIEFPPTMYYSMVENVSPCALDTSGYLQKWIQLGAKGQVDLHEVKFYINYMARGGDINGETQVSLVPPTIVNSVSVPN